MQETEAGLELLVKTLRGLVESKIKGLSPAEISLISDRIPSYKSILEFRAVRDKFVSTFNDPCQIPQPISYSEELMSNTKAVFDLPKDLLEHFDTYFSSEIERVKRVRAVVEDRCSMPELCTKMQMPFSVYNESVARHLLFCSEGLNKLESQKPEALTEHDLLRELNLAFYGRRRNALLKAITARIRRFPLTNREGIFTKMFEEAQNGLKHDYESPEVPLMLKRETELNDELRTLASRFSIPADLDSNDGQQFLYHTNKIFESMNRELDFFDLPKRKVDLPDCAGEWGLPELTQEKMLKQVQPDIKISSIFHEILTSTTEELSERIAERAKSYNVLVGNEMRTMGLGNSKGSKPILPNHKLLAWMKLRFVSMKFLVCAVLTNLNYFEYIRSKLKSKVSTVMRSNAFKCRNSPKFRELLEIYDDKGSFLFESAVEKYHAIIDEIIALASYYITKFEAQTEERRDGSFSVVDRSAMVLFFLRNEWKFLNAKRQLIQPLLEVLEHGYNEKLVEIIHSLIIERPRYNMPIYKSYASSYDMAIRLMKKKAQIIRSIVNMQIAHERQVASAIGDHVHLFERPSLVPCGDVTYRSFDESVPISPFEVYESLWKVVDIVLLVPRVSQEMSESVNVRSVRYGNYMELAVWKETEDIMKTLVREGVFPLERAASRFHCRITSSIAGLFNSPFVNTIEAIQALIARMLENRRVRFMNSMRRFMYLTWKLQSLVIKTNLFQETYSRQCELLGISERNILMTPFNESATKELIDMHIARVPEDLMDFAVTEFEKVPLDFCSESSIKDVILAADFTGLKRMIQFQKLQNTLLEIGIRFNVFILDSNFLCDYFELGKDVSPFLTGVDVADEASKLEQFFKQYVAMKLFYQSTTIFRDNQLALQDKQQLSMSIREIKSMTRTILSAHVKQKKLSEQQMVDLYLSEMLDAFTPYVYRIEIARICMLERQTLMTNSFVDTFALGPDPTTGLLNDSGTFEKFFYVPTWLEVFLMIRSAPHARQETVLKSTLQFVQSRFRILNLARHESSISQKIPQVFESIYNENFRLETPVFQELYHELGRLPNSAEAEFATTHILEKEKFLFQRFEYTILMAFEAFLVSSTSGESADVADPEFGDHMRRLWLLMHEPLPKSKGLILRAHYAPIWEEQFIYRCQEFDRSELVTRLSATDSFLEESLSYGGSSDPNKEDAGFLLKALDFLSLSISQFHIKIAYFLLLSGQDRANIDIRSTIRSITTDVYARGLSAWDKTVINLANEALVPKEEFPSRVTEATPEPILQQAIFDVTKRQIDALLLSAQINEMQALVDEFSKAMEDVPSQSKSITASKYSAMDFPETLELLSGSPVPESKPFVHEPGTPYQAPSYILNNQFYSELGYFHAKFIEEVNNSVDQCIVNKENEAVFLDAIAVENQCLKLSHALEQFTKDSFDSTTLTWKRYLATLQSKVEEKEEDNEVVSMMGRIATERFQRQTSCEVGTKFSQKFLKLNMIRYRLQVLADLCERVDQGIEMELRQYYEKILSDLKECQEATKREKASIEKQVFDIIIQKINTAKGVQLKVSEGGGTTTIGSSVDENVFDKIRGECEDIRKEIVKHRIIRCLAQRAVTLIFSKKIARVEQERKLANVALWTEKQKSRMEQESMERDLHEAHVKLSDSRGEIGQLKAMLDNERMSNVQLIHWKAKHSKVVEELQQQIAACGNVGDFNIDQLVKQLNAAHTELDELREVGEKLEAETEEFVRKPMRTAENVRKEIQQARMTGALTREMVEAETMLQAKTSKETFLQTLIEENRQIKENNEATRAKIEELELAKQRKSVYTRALMDDALRVKAPSLRAKTRFSGKILKPAVVSRSVTRI